MKTIVIGLDGGCWPLIQEWIAAGELPTLARVQREGCWADMTASLPPVTSPNWKCYATGRNPGKLGVFWWEMVDWQRRRISTPQSYHFAAPEIWDYLSQAGQRVGVVNMPTLFPPKEVNGFLIAGGPDAAEEGFTYPPELEGYLKGKYAYRVLPKYVDFISRRDPQALEEVYRLIKLRFEVARDLLAKHDPDFLHVTVFMINGLQHFFGRDPLVLQGWKIIDRCVGEFLEACPEANFLFMSDHGSNDITCKLNISTWLEREGLLVIKRSRAKQALLRLGINKDRIVRLLTRLGLRDIVKKRVGEAARNILPTSSGAVRSEGKSRLIDWERTKVYACGQGPIFLNPALPPVQRQRLRAQLKERIEALRSPFDGSAIARRVYLGEEIYSGPFAGSAPDLVIDQAPGVHITSSIGFAQVFEPPGNWRGENARVGMFAAWGPHVRPGKLEAPVHIFDLAPTILHLRGLPVDADMDGRVLKEVFAEGSPPLQREVEVARYGPLAQGLRPLEGEDNPELKRRLENLGYL